MEVIVYKNTLGGVAVTTKVNPNKTMKELALKAVPKGQDYWIVDRSTLPPEGEFRSAWELDLVALGEPDGQGGRVL